jgi:sucrose phosphorylase
MIDILLKYIQRGADFIRLDAVTCLWEELGTSCVQLKQTHLIIKLFRKILNIVAPHIALITETNVAHEENIKYFGNGYDEAQMVYKFALPPLVLYTFQNENSEKLTRWTKNLHSPGRQTTYFNFLDSHDGIGVMAVRDILTMNEIEMMSLRVIENGGYISYENNGDGTTSPYEFNITWWSALNNEDSNEPQTLQVDRYIASRAIALVFKGVPGIYIHGFLGSKNDRELVIAEKQTRSINRKNILEKELIRTLDNSNSNTFQITTRLRKLLKKRIAEPAFHPNADQIVYSPSEKLFCVMRNAPDSKDIILTITNICNLQIELSLDLKNVKTITNDWFDIVSEKICSASKNNFIIKLQPYQVLWLKNKMN